MVLTNISPSQTSSGVNPKSDLNTTTATSEGVIVPIYSNWFDYTQIHEIERRSLPEFFTSQNEGDEKTPTLYKEYRDFMVQQYRQRPYSYLSVTMVRRYLAGDVGAIIRVHSFLEQWGLINFQNEHPGVRKHNVFIPMDRVDVPNSIKSAVHIASSTVPTVGEGENVITCGNCGVVCPKIYYTQLTNVNGPKLCGLCYSDGAYPSGQSSTDFIKIDLSNTSFTGLRSPWTDEETLSLLDAIEKHGGNWDEISRQVGRPKDQCIFHFLKLPSVDTLTSSNCDVVENDLTNNIPMTGLPFQNMNNPVISTLAFLASVVHPKVAAAAAQAAIEQVEKIRTDEMRDSEVPTSDDLIKVAGTGIACAAARAQTFAEEESRKINRMRETLVELQLQKLRAKMSLYEDLEKSLEEDRKDLEQQRLQLFFDRFNLRKQMIAIDQKAGITENSRIEMDQEGEEQKDKDPTRITSL